MRREPSEISFTVHNASWIFDHLDFVRECFPHLAYVDEIDVSIRMQARHEVIVAESFGSPVGFVVWYETLPGVAYIWLVGVRENYRGRGLGAALVSRALDRIRAAGERYVWCKVAKAKYRWALKCIQQGFRVVDHVREDGADLYKLAFVFQPGADRLFYL